MSEPKKIVLNRWLGRVAVVLAVLVIAAGAGLFSESPPANVPEKAPTPAASPDANAARPPCGVAAPDTAQDVTKRCRPKWPGLGDD